VTDRGSLDRVVRSIAGESGGTTYGRRADGRQAVVSAGDGFEALTGYDPGTVGSDERGWLDLVAPEDRDDVRAATAEATPGDHIERTYRIERDDGETRWVRDRFTVAEADGLVEGVVFDVTGDVASEDSRDDADGQNASPARPDDAALLDAIFDSIPVHLFVKDTEGVHIRASDYFENRDELVGNTDLEIESVSEDHAVRGYEDDLRVIEEGEPILDKEEYLPQRDQWNLTSKVPLRDEDGRESCSDSRANQNAARSDDAGERDASSEPSRPDGREDAEAQSASSPLSTSSHEDGEIVGLIGVARDITERKRAKEELRHKTERLEEFADVLSHDIRNPLTVANGHLELAEMTGETEHVDEVRSALERADAIIDDVYALSRHGEADLDPEPVSLNTICHGAAHSVSAPRADVSFPADVKISADRSQLRRLLENLFKNAVQHGRADVSIDVSIIAGDDPPTGDEQSGDDPTTIGFAVEDDGPGIPESEREQVFETNYTTHEDGTGFGLAIVEEIAAGHGWDVALTEGSAGGGERSDGSRSSEDERSESSGARFEFTGVERAE
jgi:signal transduction histidine kinase